MSSYTATYCPEDNKLRLTSLTRLSKELYDRVRSHGFRWAPKQEIFVAPGWSPGREDFLLDEFVDEIEDEDYSPEERAADRAERFWGYLGKRRSEAGDLADRFDDGPSAFGHQNRARAERQAARHDRFRSNSLSRWSKAEYWRERTAGVISHALHKSSARVRRGRLLRLESEQRKHLADVESSKRKWNAWKDVAAQTDPEKATTMAKWLVGHLHFWGEYKHPRKDKESHLSTLLEPYGDPESPDFDPITGHEAAALYLENMHADGPGYEGGYSDRWNKHYELRIEYEKAMLENEGGMAADVEMEAGGWIGKYQIHRVNKSNATGRVCSVMLMGEKDYYRGEPVKRPDGTFGAPLVLKRFNVERLGEKIYRAPTDEERAKFAAEVKEKKKRTKEANAGAPKLLNPTDEDAERLQAHWNAKSKSQHDKRVAEHRDFGEYVPSEVFKLTQEQYSARSKGSYAHFETIPVCQHGHRQRREYGQAADASPVAFLVRKVYGKNYSADRVIVLTDKPGKPLPLDWEALNAVAVPQAPKVKESTDGIEVHNADGEAVGTLYPVGAS